MENMKESYMNLISDREYLLMVAEMYHSALKKEEEKSENITNKLEVTNNLLKRHKDPFKIQSYRSFNFRRS